MYIALALWHLVSPPPPPEPVPREEEVRRVIFCEALRKSCCSFYAVIVSVVPSAGYGRGRASVYIPGPVCLIHTPEHSRTPRKAGHGGSARVPLDRQQAICKGEERGREIVVICIFFSLLPVCLRSKDNGGHGRGEKVARRWWLRVGMGSVTYGVAWLHRCGEKDWKLNGSGRRGN